MSAAHQIKKAAQAIHLKNWEVGKRRNVDGVVYASRREARFARAQKRAAAAA